MMFYFLSIEDAFNHTFEYISYCVKMKSFSAGIIPILPNVFQFGDLLTPSGVTSSGSMVNAIINF